MQFLSEASAKDESTQKTPSDLRCPVATQVTVSENTKQSFYSSTHANQILSSTLPPPKDTFDSKSK